MSVTAIVIQIFRERRQLATGYILATETPEGDEYKLGVTLKTLFLFFIRFVELCKVDSMRVDLLTVDLMQSCSIACKN